MLLGFVVIVFIEVWFEPAQGQGNGPFLVSLCIENCRNELDGCKISIFSPSMDSKEITLCDADWNVTKITDNTFLVQKKRNDNNVTQSWECANGNSSAFHDDNPDRLWSDAWSYSYQLHDGRWYSGLISKMSVKKQSAYHGSIIYYLCCRTKKNNTSSFKYIAVKNRLNQSQAQFYCSNTFSSLRGTLCSFQDQIDFDKVIKLTETVGKGWGAEDFWTGLITSNNTSEFVDGTDATFATTWMKNNGQIINGHNETCVVVAKQTPERRPCTDEEYFVCKITLNHKKVDGKETSSLSHLPTSTTSHGKATSSLSHLPTSTASHGKETSSLSNLPTSTTSHGKETSSLSHLPTSATSHGKETSSLSHLPTSAPSHGKETSSLSHLPTSTTSHGKETSSLSHLPTSTTSHGKETSSLNHLPTSTISHGKASAASSSQAACVGMSTTRVENHKLEGSVFSQFRVKNIAQCGMKCFDEKECRSFNFIPSSLSCELNNSTGRLGSKNLKPAPGVTYFYRNGRMLQAS